MPGNDLTLLMDAAKDAGEIAKRFFRSEPQVWDKPDGAGPVTEADLAVNAMLRDRLMGARPDYGWLSEESEDDPARSTAERTFVIDPIDGTRSFMEGNATWAHSLAIVENGVPTAAVVYLPARDKMYHAETGQGAFHNDAPLFVTGRDTMQDATVLAAKPNLFAENWKGGAPPLKRHFRASLAYRLSLVGEGRFDAMMTLRPTWEWDIAAGMLIVQEAGGVVTSPDGQELVFNNRKPQVAGVVAAGPRLHDQITKALLT
ncbi:inositol monophosphatase family protein [Pseudaestuariivita rosea]|uniref:inositol monophosphatase family protein n=1 Tax=Pseudaestuariivita rosea TaxID=2763263 RepID=UPI001ABAF635|nr:3'(2'),5'-bisphosphate nucleotidase CysQ [Pseudaestuariivita rosea]